MKLAGIAQARVTADGCRPEICFRLGVTTASSAVRITPRTRSGSQKARLRAWAANRGASRAPRAASSSAGKGDVDDQLGAQDQHFLLRPRGKDALHQGHAVAEEAHPRQIAREGQDRAEFDRWPLDRDRGWPRASRQDQAMPVGATPKMRRDQGKRPVRP